MRVKTPPGVRCPKDGEPRSYITDAGADVPDTPYYRRLVADGSLLPAPAKKGVTTDGQ